MERELFRSRIGSIMALAGSAVGLGNIWRFPYMLAEYGGGAFLLVYIFCIVLFSLPIMLSEFIVGRKSRMGAAQAVGTLEPDGLWRHYGILAVGIPFFTLCYYCVIGGWTLQYFIDSCTMQFSRAESADAIQGMFESLITSTYRPLVLDAVFLLVTALIIKNGVHKGIEKCSNVMMPVLFFVMIFIAVWVAFQPGAGQGIAYLLKPDFSKITPKVFLAAMGQSFYSLSIGMGILITYSSYLERSTGLTRTAISTILADMLFAVIAGCAIIPALFAYDMPTGQGTGVLFKTLPVVFSRMPAGGLVSVVFFVGVLLAALTSAMALFEVPVSWLIDRYRMSRVMASVIVFAGALVIGALCSLSFGVLSDFTIGGRVLFDAIDYGVGNCLIPLSGLIIVLFAGCKLGKEVLFQELRGIDYDRNERYRHIWQSILFFMIRWIAPAAVIAIFISGIL